MAELIFPSAASWIDAAEAGQKAGTADRMTAARRSAGGFMASGDYKGAAASLYGAGDFANGSTVAQAGYTQATETSKLAAKAAVQAKLATGDFAGAYQAAGTDADMLSTLDKVAAHAKQTTSELAAALQALKGPDGQWLPPDTARQKYAAIKPTLLARGMDPKQLDGFDPTPENLEAIQGQVLGLDKQLEMHKGIAVGADIVNPYSGNVIHEGTEWKAVAPGGKLVPVTGGKPGTGIAVPADAPSAAPQGAAPPTGGIYNQVAQIASAKGAKPEEVGYLQNLAQVESHGDPSAQNGRSTGLFQFHPDTMAAAGGGDIHSVDDQTAAALTLSRRDRANLQQIGVEPSDANVYIMHQQGAGGGRALLTAPPEVGAVAVLTPVYGSAKIAERAIVGNGGTPDMTAGDFVKMWQARWANGGRPVTGGQGAPSAAPSANPHAGDPPGTVYGGVEWQSDGKGNLINLATGDRKIDPTGGADVQANPELVKMIIDGRAPVPTTGRQAADPKWQAAMAEAMRQDPTLSAADYQTRVKTRMDFATGKAAQTKTALNTALGHAGDLNGQIDGLHNTTFPDINALKVGIEGHLGDPRLKPFNQTKEALMHEAMKVFSGSVGSMTEFQRLADTLKITDSPASQHATVKKLVELLASKMDALSEQYKNGMGKEADGTEFLSPHARNVFYSITGIEPANTAPQPTPEPTARAPAAPPAKPTAAPTAPVRVNSVAEAMALAPGTPFITPDGRHKVR